MTDFIWYFLVVLGFGAAYFIYTYFSSLEVIKRRINKQYGKPIDSNEKKVNLESVKNYFLNRKDNLPFYVDDITWDDLNMDDIYLTINNTQSSIGEEVLYNILREPLFNEKELKERDEMIEYFDRHDKERFDVQMHLGKLGRNPRAKISTYLYNATGNAGTRLNLYRFLALLPLLSLGACFFSVYAILVLLGSILLNIYIHFQVQKGSSFKFDDYAYIVSMVGCSKKILDMDISEINSKYPNVSDSLSKVKSILNKYVNMNSVASANDAMVLSEYTKMLFLSEVRKFEKISGVISKNAEALLELYDYVGTVDSMIAVASYRRTLSFYSKPKLSVSTDIKASSISFKDIYHPLIKEPVLNSCSITRPILLTGSNASGKSTFLKVIAINSLMSQTIYTAFARDFASCFVRLYTSMALKDNIFNNESYFIVEIKSLKRIIDALNNETPCLCFIDEILRGTNTVERISASSEVLDYFANSNCICIAATHDVELTKILENDFENYHFQESIKGNEITFDYKLYKGRAETRNAIKLLGFMGYNKAIIDRAEDRAENFMNSGEWQRI